jgi:ABC-2 type transport system permease protein
MTTITRAPSTLIAGLPMMVRFVLRRNWLRLTVWAIVLCGMVALVVQSQAELFPTQADREAYGQVANTPAVAALTGLPYAATTLGGILVIKLWMTHAVALSLAVIFLVTRNGRAEEENGRLELIRAGAVGRHSVTLAGWIVAALLCVVVGLGCALAAISQGLPVDGSLAMGASFTGIGIAFLGVAALAGQLASTGRGANSLAAIVLGIAYLIRAVADLNSTGEQASPVAWASPIGWAQHIRAYGDNNWAPFFLLLGLGALLCVTAVLLESRRDLGAGLLPHGRGPSRAARLTRTAIGLSLRLQRGSLIGWTIGILIGAAFFGSVATAMATLLDSGSALATALLGSGTDVVGALLGYFAMANAMLVAAFAAQSALAVRADEASGAAELQWSLPISRWWWAGARLLVPAGASLCILALSGALIGASYGATIDDPSQVGRVALAAITYWPSVLAVIGAVAFLSAWLPRAAVAITWALFAASAVLGMAGNLVGLPDDVVNNTVFTALPRLGATDSSALPMVVISTVAVTLGIAGVWRLRTRDMVSA